MERMRRQNGGCLGMCGGEHLAVVGKGGTAEPLCLALVSLGGGADRRADCLPQVPGNRQSKRDFTDGQPVAYPVFGEASFKEPCLVVSAEDGARGVRLRFVEDREREIDGWPGLELLFRDDL